MLSRPPASGTAMLPLGTFDGKVVAITGGGTGLGKAMAVEFARLGATVVILSRSEHHLAGGIAAVSEAGGKAIGVTLDVRDGERVRQAFDEIEAQCGSPDVLINNASGTFTVPAEDMSPNAWRSVVQIVLDGTFFCSREFARRRMTANSGGAILNIGSSYAWTGGPGSAHLSAAKAGITNLTQSLAVEWASSDIRVNTLVPGPFPHGDLPDHLKALYGSPEAAKKLPAHRVGEPHELGWAATYLCSPFAAFVTGHTFVIDGAYWLRHSLHGIPFSPVREQIGAPPFHRE
ncbi:MAG TPA: SDR family oxidoreductase [Novosphingobium sp.]|nr:SDR family oxidoreductase [Novosphingobium sp.]